MCFNILVRMGREKFVKLFGQYTLDVHVEAGPFSKNMKFFAGLLKAVADMDTHNFISSIRLTLTFVLPEYCVVFSLSGMFWCEYFGCFIMECQALEEANDDSRGGCYMPKKSLLEDAMLVAGTRGDFGVVGFVAVLVSCWGQWLWHFRFADLC